MGAVGEMRRMDQARRSREARSTRFVGRSDELTRLDAALAGARDGRGGAVLVAGDPGIGKTQTAEEAAERAESLGFRTYWGRCHSDAGAPSLWPWLQVLRAHTERSEPNTLRTELGAHASVLAAVLPALRERLPVLSAPPTLHAEESRFRLLEAITGWIRRASATSPWLVLLDDLQWADLPTLQLFRFAARELRDAPVLLVGTLRDTELDPAGDALRVLREAGAQRIDLTGFAETQVAQLLAPKIGDAQSAAWARAVCAATGGNPFFVDRVARLLPAGGDGTDADALRIPEEVRDVILGQLARLDAEDARVVATAAVIGRDFELSLLARVCELDTIETLRRLGTALEARLVREGADPRHYGFVHPLIQEVVYGSLSPAERDGCNRRVGEALESWPAGDGGDHLAQLAHHFVNAAHLGVAERAAHYADRAAEAAATLSAYEEAVRLLEAALALYAREPANDLRRVDLELRLGEAFRGASDHTRARRAFGEAAATARRLGDPERLARAALGFAGFWASLGFVDAKTTALLEEAVAQLGDAAPAQRSRLLARHALELTLGCSGDRALLESTSARALDLARESGDEAALAHALYARQLALGVGHLPSLWTKAAELAERAGEIDLALAALAWKTGEALQVGDMAGFDVAASEHAALAGTALHRTAALNQIVWRGIRAIYDGRFADAEGVIGEIPRRFEPPQVASYAAPAILAIRWHQGRIAEMEPLLRGLADALPGTSSGHVWLAWIHTEQGDLDAARARMERVVANGFDLLARSPFLHLETTLLGQVMAATGDADRADWIVEKLRPIARQRAVNAGLCDFGPVARTLGLLAAARGDFDLAVAELSEAVAADVRIGSKPHRVHCEIDLVRVLRERGAPGDAVRADELAERARDAARALDMHGALAKLDALRPAPTAPAATGGAIEAELVREARGLWTLRSQGRVHHLGDVKGLAHLCELLRDSGQPRAAVDLVGDAPALRTDLAALREALEDAVELGDVERIESLRDALESRVAGREDVAERARVNVTRALKLAMRRIAEADARLGRDLEANLRTGAYCSYESDPHHPVHWVVTPGAAGAR